MTRIIKFQPVYRELKWRPTKKVPRLILSVIWLPTTSCFTRKIIFVKVEKGIYSGILRLTDLAFSIVNGDEVFYIIIPNKREKVVRMQLSRPSIKSVNDSINYILFSEVRQNCDALCKFGENHHILEKIAKTAV
ncbi:MAG: hypothetical protein GZ094_20385 [Mariniphaga sp.]|nr:hypothetical protein [Mariniphaga sp.]